MADPKLPNIRRHASRGSTKRNPWLTADRIETAKSVALFVAAAAVLIAGVWLIVVGLSS